MLNAASHCLFIQLFHLHIKQEKKRSNKKNKNNMREPGALKYDSVLKHLKQKAT